MFYAEKYPLFQVIVIRNAYGKQLPFKKTEAGEAKKNNNQEPGTMEELE